MQFYKVEAVVAGLVLFFINTAFSQTKSNDDSPKEAPTILSPYFIESFEIHKPTDSPDSQPFNLSGDNKATVSTENVLDGSNSILSSIPLSPIVEDFRSELRHKGGTGSPKKVDWLHTPFTTKTYLFSYYFPEDMVFDPVEETIMQWKNQKDPGCDVGTPPFSIRISDDNIKYNIKYDPDRCGSVPTTIYGNINKSLTRGVWHHFVVEIHYDYRVTNNEGHVKIWYSEQDPVTIADSVLDYRGPVGFNDKLWPYFKVGIYKSEWKLESNRIKSANAGVKERKMWIDRVGVIDGPWNHGPIANAGPDKTLILPNDKVTLEGAGSVSNGLITSYKWTQQSGPNDAILTEDKNLLSTSNLIEGSYVFRLTVTNDLGVQAYDDVSVTVQKSSNQLPIANAGKNKTITLPINKVTLNGSGADSDGSVIGYQWVQVSGPSTATLTGADTTDPEASGLVQGTYVFKLTVIDNQEANGSDEMSVIVEPGEGEEPTDNEDPPVSNPVSVTANITDASCGAKNGAVTLAISGGKGPFSFDWSNGATSKDIANIASGNYNVTITDQDGTSVNRSYIVNASKPLKLAAEIEHTSCTMNNGAILVQVSGGVAPYSFSWSTGQKTSNIRQLASGNYSLVVEDKNGCQQMATFEVPVEPAETEFTLSSEVINASCENDGSISLSVLGDNGPYTYSWSNGHYGSNLTGLGLGVYQVLIKDKHGCFMKERFVVYQDEIVEPVIRRSGDSLLVEQEAVHYQWYKDGIVLEGSVQNYLRVNETGSYSVQIAEGNCTNISKPLLVEDFTATLSNTLTFNQVDIFPNPVVDHLNVKIQLNQNAPTRITIYDFQGTRLQTQDLGTIGAVTTAKLDVSPFPNGIYFIEITSANEVVTRKFIKTLSYSY